MNNIQPNDHDTTNTNEESKIIKVYESHANMTYGTQLTFNASIEKGIIIN